MPEATIRQTVTACMEDCGSQPRAASTAPGFVTSGKKPEFAGQSSRGGLDSSLESEGEDDAARARTYDQGGRHTGAPGHWPRMSPSRSLLTQITSRRCPRTPLRNCLCNKFDHHAEVLQKVRPQEDAQPRKQPPPQARDGPCVSALQPPPSLPCAASAPWLMPWMRPRRRFSQEWRVCAPTSAS